MSKLKINYNQISQMVGYFKSLEETILTFAQRRKLISLNEALGKEQTILNAELQRIIDLYCEKNEDGTTLILDNGGSKIKESEIANCNKALEEIYLTEVEIEIQPFKLPEMYFDNFRCDVSTFTFIEENFIG